MSGLVSATHKFLEQLSEIVKPVRRGLDYQVKSTSLSAFLELLNALPNKDQIFSILLYCKEIDFQINWHTRELVVDLAPTHQFTFTWNKVLVYLKVLRHL